VEDRSDPPGEIEYAVQARSASIRMRCSVIVDRLYHTYNLRGGARYMQL
jgi:hypothetical protein